MPKDKRLSRGVITGVSSGRFGEVLEHPYIRGLKWMVLGPGASRRHLAGIVTSSPLAKHAGATDLGEVTHRLAPDGWIVYGD